jgi:hypothetical protein
MKRGFLRNVLYPVLFSILVLGSCKQSFNHAGMKSIPETGNSWVINKINNFEPVIGKNGIVNWTDTATRIRTYFRVDLTGTINLALRARISSGKSKLLVRFGNTTREIPVSNREFDTIFIGTFTIEKPGYQWLEMKGLKKSDSTFAEVTDLLIGGAVTEGKVNFVKDDFHFGRRGPSVHLRYDLPQNAGDIIWFYNEITVPEGNDVLGSYFMANGFTDGYFGMQVNRPEERRILFSVWSPYKTDNPKNIPEEYRIKLLKKGEDVNAGEFGNEGSGGQSYKKFIWKAGTTYRFLLKGQPSINKSTDYTAYFFAPEIGKWQLIASFRRPKTTNYLKNLYSFLENFWPNSGAVTRKGYFSNQWVYNKNGKWCELTNVKFTADATARKEARMDYAGGMENGMFFLKNCGFFNDRTEINSSFSRPATGKMPDVDFKLLEK